MWGPMLPNERQWANGFGLFDDLERLLFCKNKLANKYSEGRIYLLKTI